MKQLYRSHRVFGFELDRFYGPDGKERVLLQTAPNQEAVSPAHMLMPVSPQEIAFETRIQLLEAIDRARFLGLTDDDLRNAFETALRAS